jgi:predicted ATP-dependent serine protease
MSTIFTTAANIVIPDEYFNRITTGVEAFDALLGEGLLPGSLITLSAKHGTGKTQFCLQLLEALSNTHCVGYVSNEESIEQLAFTCKRISTYNVPVANIRTVEDVAACTKDLDVLVVDSFSKLEVDEVSSTRKTERIALREIIAAAKANKCCVILITHNTKTGQSKGSSQVQHDVDATLYIEKVEYQPGLRKIWFDKNRFGCPHEIYMELTANGYSLVLCESPTNTEDSDAPRESRTTQLYQSITSLLDETGISSAAEVAQAIGVEYYRAMTLLREMRAMGKVVKTGRGPDAEYSLTAPDQASV